jgi:SAM-dependent methyltransferase
MKASPHVDDDQGARWNGRAGLAWVDAQPLLDQMFQPFEDILLDAVRGTSARHILDVGCGAGSTTLAVARLLGTQGSCTGIDISHPMIAAAQRRATQERLSAHFIQADAQRHAFEHANFDLLISRFGVMFFEQPVEAFTQLRHAASDNAQLRMIAWRSAAENPFMTTAEHAAAPLLPNLPPRKPGAPGQFSFADRQRVASILEESGWADIDIEPINVDCSLPEEKLVRYLSQLGPVGLALQEVDEETRAHVIGVVRKAFDDYVREAEVRYTAACWMISACAPQVSAAQRSAHHA